MLKMVEVLDATRENCLGMIKEKILKEVPQSRKNEAGLRDMAPIWF